MAEDSKKDSKLNHKDSKTKRLAQNLKANLLRRKQQDRQRKTLESEIEENKE